MTEALLCPYTDDLNWAFCNSPPQSSLPGIMLDRSCSCHPTLPRSRGAKIKLMNSCVRAGAQHPCAAALWSLNTHARTKTGSGKTWDKTKQKVPNCTPATAKQLHNSKNHYSSSLNGTAHRSVGEHGSKKLININTSILTTWGTSLTLGRNSYHGKSYSKGTENSQLPGQKQLELFAVIRLETTPGTMSFILLSHDI